MTLKLTYSGREYQVDVANDGHISVDGTPYDVRRQRDGTLRIGSRTAWVVQDDDVRWVFIEGRVFEIGERRATGRRRGGGHHGSLTAPMPATVRRILVSVGDVVKSGDSLMLLEAMKMELPVRASTSGTVRALCCREGELVQPGVPLAEIE